jgi:pyruvate dehydrogenase complex dehydrogenase (E1) component
VIVQDGVRRMLEAQEDVFYYLTVSPVGIKEPGIFGV